MLWLLFLAGYFVFGVGAYLWRRNLAQSLSSHSRFVNGFFFLAVHYPIGLLVAAFMRPSLHIGWLNLILLLVGSSIFPLANVLAYRASNEVDAGLYTTLNNLRPIVTITTAWLLLHQVLAGRQIFGAAIVIAATLLVTLPHLHRIRQRNSGLALAIASITLVGIGTTFESFMLHRMQLGAYLVFGWGTQALWMGVLALPERRQLSLLQDRRNIWPILWYSLSTSLKGLFFTAALKLSGSASLVSASASFMAVLVVLAAYVTLREKGWIWLKGGAALAGALGLLFLNSP